MKLITIKYKPVRLIPFLMSVTRLYPDRWEDISGEQLDAFELLASNRIDEKKFLAVMLDVPVKLVKRFTPFENYNLLVALEFMRNVKDYHKRCDQLGREASIDDKELFSPFYYFTNQIKQAEK